MTVEESTSWKTNRVPRASQRSADRSYHEPFVASADGSFARRSRDAMHPRQTKIENTFRACFVTARFIANRPTLRCCYLAFFL